MWAVKLLHLTFVRMKQRFEYWLLVERYLTLKPLRAQIGRRGPLRDKAAQGWGARRPSGAKPLRFSVIFGTTKVVPCYKAKVDPSLLHPGDEDLSLRTPIWLKDGYVQDDSRGTHC